MEKKIELMEAMKKNLMKLSEINKGEYGRKCAGEALAIDCCIMLLTDEDFFKDLCETYNISTPNI